MYWLAWIVAGLFLMAHDMASAATLTLPEAELTFHVPEGFSPLTAEEIAQAFETDRPPKQAVGNKARTTTIAFDFQQTPFRVDQLREAKPVIESLFERTFQELVWKERRIITLQGQEWLFFEITRTAPEGKFHNIVLMTSRHGRLLRLSFNSTLEEFPAVENVLRKSIQSIAFKKSVSSGRTAPGELDGSLKLVESSSVPFQVIVNEAPVEVPAIHAKGTFGNQQAEFWILDDIENPLSLKWSIGNYKLQVIKLAFPSSAVSGGGATTERIEKALREEGRTVVYGIYFDFASDRIKEESASLLKEIADVMTKNPTWRLAVEGHTDSVGDKEANLLLSQRRAAAVRKALGDRYQIAPTRLEPAGFGETRPKATNETLEGRALNRRVELVRIGS